MSFLPITWAEQLRNLALRERIPLTAVLGLTCLAKAGALLPGYSIDDYGPTTDGPGPLLGDVLSKGRLGHWLFLKLAMAMQAEPNAARVLFVFCSLVAYAACGLAVIRFWRFPGDGWLPVAAAALVANHPYTCEIFTFRVGLPLAAIVMALLSFLMFLACQPRNHFVVGGIIFAAALSFYQIALHFSLMIVLLGAAIGLCRWLLARSAAGESSRSALRLRASQLGKERNSRLLLFTLSGLFLYSAAFALFGQRLGINPGYFGLLPWQDIPGRTLTVAAFVFRTFSQRNVLVTPIAQVTFALGVVALLAGLAGIAFRKPFRLTSCGGSLGILLLLAGAALWSVGVVLLRKEYWPVPRTMAHVGVLWAGCLVLLALTMAGRPWTSRALGAAAAVILISFIGVSQRVFDDQYRLNVRDRYKAERIIERLEASPGFAAVKNVAFVGKTYWYPRGPQKTQWGDLNISAFGASWGQLSLLREVAGYDLRPLANPQQKAAAAVYCSGVEPWPAAGSIAVRGPLGIVCLARNPAP